MTIGSLRCTGCGWHMLVASDDDPIIGAIRDDPAALAGTVARHLEVCPKRYRGHPAFGQEARWWTILLYDGPYNEAREHIEFAWCIGIGDPFDIAAAK